MGCEVGEEQAASLENQGGVGFRVSSFPGPLCLESLQLSGMFQHFKNPEFSPCII